MKTVIVNEIDGDTFHTFEHGPMDDVMARATPILQHLIRLASRCDNGKAQMSWTDENGDHTVKVIVK